MAGEQDDKKAAVAPSTSPVTFIDNPHAPDVFADDFSGMWLHGNVVRITLESARIHHIHRPAPINRVVIGRLVMPVQAAQKLAAQLFDFLKKNGIEPPGVAPGTRVQ